MSGRAGVGRRAGVALALALVAALLAAPVAASTPTPTSCVVRVAATQAWATSASTSTAVWELDVATAAADSAAVPAPWTLGVTLAAQQAAVVTAAWNLDGVGVVSNGTLTTAAVVGHAPAYWQALPAHGTAAARVGLVVEYEERGDGPGAGAGPGRAARGPTAATLNGAPCTLVAAEDNAPLRPAAVVAPPAPATKPAVDDGDADGGGTPLPPPGMSTKDGQILGPDDTPLFFRGLNWFGFEVGATAPDGLWGGSNAIAKDFATVVWRLKLLGFNAVRLPFSFSDLWSIPPKPLANACASVTPDAVVAATTPPPGAPAAGFTTAPPLSSAPGPGAASLASVGMGGACNAGVPGPGSATAPGATTLDRFLWTASYFAANGFYLLLDNQFNLDQTALNDPALWVARWTELATRLVREHPAAAAVTMIDALNEPDAWGLRWEAQAGKPGMTDLYLSVMDALDAVYSGFLYVVEGCGQAPLAKNWGDGLATDPAVIAARGLSDPNPFFRALLGKPYVGRVVAGPHIYGPSVARTTSEMTGPALYRRLSTSFGYLNRQGYCPDGPDNPATCVRFPVILGETGTGFLSYDDLQFQMDVAAWAMTGRPGTPPNEAAADGRHNAVSGVFWWCWNANSEGQMGVVRNDWTALNWNIVGWLEWVGLRPWWVQAGSAVEDSGGGGSSGADGAAAGPTVPALLRGGRAPVRAAAPVAATATTNASFSLPSFSGDLFGWGLRSGGLALGGSGSGGGVAPPPPSPPPLPWVPSAEAGGGTTQPTTHPLSTDGPLILGAAGHPVDLRAVAWPAGFTANASSAGVLETDIAAALARTAALGFNAIKIPLDLQAVLRPGPAAPPLPAGPCPGTGADAAALAAATLPPTVAQSAWTVFPPFKSTPSSTACNAYLPSASTLDRLAGVVAAASAAGLYTILEDAGGPTHAGLAGADTRPGAWVGAWAAVGTAVAPAAGGKLAFRLAADPDVAGVGWVPGVAPPLGPGPAAPTTTAASAHHPGLGALLLAAMDALHAAAPGSLFLIPGAGQAAGMGGITGGGYDTAVDAATTSTSSTAQAAAAATFFTTLATRPYARQAVVSPSWQPPSARSGGSGAPPSTPQTEWAALEAAWGRLSHARPLMLGSFGGPPPPAQLVQATVTGGDGVGADAEPVSPTSLSDDAAALASFAAWLQPTCGLPACAAAAAAGVASPGGGHVPVRSWAWDGWMVAEEGEEDAAARPVVLSPAPGGGGGSDGTTTTTLPPVDWAITAFLGGLGAVPWFAPPTPEWRGPPPPGPAPGLTSSSKDTTAPSCVATFTVSSPGRAAGNGTAPTHAVGILALTLTAAADGPSSPLAPPYTLVVRPKAGGSYLGLRALAGATDAVLAPGGAALSATVGDPWATLWATVSVAAVLEAKADGGGGVSPSAALVPGFVSVGGRACRLVAAGSKPHQAEGGGRVGGGGAAIPSLMQVVIPP